MYRKPRSKPPRLVKWRGDWCVFTTDPRTRKQRRLLCRAYDALNDKQRKAMLDEFTDEWHEARLELNRGQAGREFDYRLHAALGLYLDDVERRADLRVRAGGREGLAPATAKRIREVLAQFTAYMPKTLTTGQLDAHRLQEYFSGMTGRSAATINAHRRHLRACFRWLSLRRPRLFPDPDSLWPAFKQSRVQPRAAVAISPSELTAFMARLSVPQARLCRFLALVGCRLKEVGSAQLRGNVVVLEGKTGVPRYLPLTGAPEGEVAPRLLAELQESGIPRVRHDRAQWKRKGGITPQVLRRNFTSYAASIGIPPAVSALWQGHSLAVAERYYRQQVLERMPGKSIEDAMGL